MIDPNETNPPKRGVPIWVQALIWVFLSSLLVIVYFRLYQGQQGTIQPGKVVDDFSLTLYNGYEYKGNTEVRLSDFRGKIVVINFWASWCKPCEQEAAELQEAWLEYEPTNQVVFLGVDYLDTEPDARLYLKKFGITFANGPDLATGISQYFRIAGVPETYFVDRSGVLHYVQVGPFTSIEQIRNILDPMLNE